LLTLYPGRILHGVIPLNRIGIHEPDQTRRIVLGLWHPTPTIEPILYFERRHTVKPACAECFRENSKVALIGAVASLAPCGFSPGKKLPDRLVNRLRFDLLGPCVIPGPAGGHNFSRLDYFASVRNDARRLAQAQPRRQRIERQVDFGLVW